MMGYHIAGLLFLLLATVVMEMAVVGAALLTP